MGGLSRSVVAEPHPPRHRRHSAQCTATHRLNESAETGEPHIFDKHSGVPLLTAANASGAVPGLWPVVTAQGRNWIDGGSCSPVNAGLAAGYDRIVVIAPVVAGLGGMPGATEDVAAMSVRSQVVLLSSDAQTQTAIGENVFDPTRRGTAAEAGRRQGQEAAGQVHALWNLAPARAKFLRAPWN
jgi:NTE family protein